MLTILILVAVSAALFLLAKRLFRYLNGDREAFRLSRRPQEYTPVQPVARKITFSERYGLMRAALSGQKTSTRIILTCNPNGPCNIMDYPEFVIGSELPVTMSYEDMLHISERSLREMLSEPNGSVLKDEYREVANSRGWKDKAYADPDLMLFHVRITGCTVQHLQDITDEEILKEGVQDFGDGKYGFRDEEKEFLQAQVYDSPREAYAALVEKTEGEYLWMLNPWVLAVEFESLDKELLMPLNPLSEEEKKSLTKN